MDSRRTARRRLLEYLGSELKVPHVELWLRLLTDLRKRMRLVDAPEPTDLGAGSVTKDL